MLMDGWYMRRGQKAHYYKESKIILVEDEPGIKFLCGLDDEDELSYIRYNSIDPEDSCRLCREQIDSSDNPEQFIAHHHPNAPKSTREKDQKKTFII